MSEPLPEEIAGLIARVEACAERLAGKYSGPEMFGFFMNEIADALRALAPERDSDETLQSLAEQCRLECARAEEAEAERDAIRALAQENERLNALISDYREIVDGKAKRIRELETGRDWLAKRSNDLQTLANTFAKERDAIRAKTIEECEQAIIEYGKKNGVSRHTHGPLNAIRALAQANESADKANDQT